MIYLNNAATSFPKPPGVVHAATKALSQYPEEPDRGSGPARSNSIMQCRRLVAHFFNARNEEEVIFTGGATHALNLGIQGTVKRGDRVVSSVTEHNSVLRPLHTLQRDEDVALTLLPCSSQGIVDPGDLEAALREPASLVVLSACSNVTGAIQDIESFSRIASSHGVTLMIDAAQAAGTMPVDMKATGADMIAVAGHKGLPGFAGIGVLLVREGLQLRPLITGGTGVQSESLLQPKKRPIAYEAGTPNRIGTASLAAAIEYVLEQKPGALQSLRQQRAAELHEGVCGLDGLHLYGPPPGPRQSGIVCLSIEGMQAGDIAYVLQEAYEVTTRAGLHCAPLMAKAIDAPAGGTLRLSPSPFTTTDEIESACTAIRAIASGI